jgi:hypothetical protein
MKNNINEYKLKDFYTCAVLLASGLHIKRLEKSEGNFFTFVFNDSDLLAEKIIKAHWDRMHLLPTRTLIEAINELKTRIYSGI